ncbi:MAG TPA: hypothetical protein VMU50_20650 [Polyangia bacterium]|nr:hypothetical protein [Polyangia bacterium]
MKTVTEKANGKKSGLVTAAGRAAPLPARGRRAAVSVGPLADRRG